MINSETEKKQGRYITYHNMLSGRIYEFLSVKVDCQDEMLKKISTDNRLRNLCNDKEPLKLTT